MMQAFIFTFLYNFVCQFCIIYFPSLPLYHSYDFLFLQCIRIVGSFVFWCFTMYSECPSDDIVILHRIRIVIHSVFRYLHCIRIVLISISLFYILFGMSFLRHRYSILYPDCLPSTSLFYIVFRL